MTLVIGDAVVEPGSAWTIAGLEGFVAVYADPEDTEVQWCISSVDGIRDEFGIMVNSGWWHTDVIERLVDTHGELVQLRADRGMSKAQALRFAAATLAESGGNAPWRDPSARFLRASAEALDVDAKLVERILKTVGDTTDVRTVIAATITEMRK